MFVYVYGTGRLTVKVEHPATPPLAPPQRPPHTQQSGGGCAHGHRAHAWPVQLLGCGLERERWNILPLPRRTLAAPQPIGISEPSSAG